MAHWLLYPLVDRLRTSPIGLAILLAGFGTSFAFAQPSTLAAPDERTLLEGVPSVFAASKYDQPLTEAPADVSIVTRAEILRYGWRTLADVLRGVRGFLVTNDRNYAYAGVRGFARTGDYNGRILLTVDGHRVNDTIYDQALLGTEGPVDLDLVERVEIVRGAGSSVYGSNAFFGVINLITRRGRDVGGVEVVAARRDAKHLRRAADRGRPHRQPQRVPDVGHGRPDRRRRRDSSFRRSTGGGARRAAMRTAGSRRWRKWRTGGFTLSGALRPADEARCLPRRSTRSSTTTATRRPTRARGSRAATTATWRAATSPRGWRSTTTVRGGPGAAAARPTTSTRTARRPRGGRANSRTHASCAATSRWWRAPKSQSDLRNRQENGDRTDDRAARDLRALLLRDRQHALLGAVRAGGVADRAGMGRDDRRAPRSLLVRSAA